MRFLILFGLLALIDLYAFQAFRVVSQNWSSNIRGLTFALYWSIPVLSLFYLLAVQNGWTDNWSKSVVSLFRAFIFIFYLAKFLIASVILIDDLRRVVLAGYEQIAGNNPFDKSRSRFMANLALLIGAIPFSTLTYGILRNRHRYQVIRKTVSIKGLPAVLDGLKIVQISDIHSGSFTSKEPVRKSVELINEQQPDLVFFTGDLVNYRASEALEYVDVFGQIQSRFGVYSILGNHDYGDYVRWERPEDKVANLEQLAQIHRSMGWKLLLNDTAQVDIDGVALGVIGVENYSAHPRFPKYGDLAQAYEKAADCDLKVLLSHDPSHWKDQVTGKYQDIALTLSGHTHGMQFGIEIPGWIKWSPIKYVYKEWSGLYQEGEQYLYVNKGLGYLGYPGRVGMLPEITVLQLEAA